MIKAIRGIFFVLSIMRLVPHLIIFILHSKKDSIRYDITRWLTIKKIKGGTIYGFLYLMTYFAEYRNLFYYRTGIISRPVKFLCPHMDTLFITTTDIGPGLFIQHGFATIIAAQSIGKDCWINQQVTIGYNDKLEAPVIEDNVTIYAGAKVIGNVHIGRNVIVGANAVVVKNVPGNCTVVGVPAYIVKQNGLKVKGPL